jgi:hypothetical protein
VNKAHPLSEWQFDSSMLLIGGLASGFARLKRNPMTAQGNALEIQPNRGCALKGQNERERFFVMPLQGMK